ncbi:OmpP1/FadL family transporter [Tenacibaculum jejuense]|uniref:Putative outer membrane protein n=1 Tax=Tenacibaculum jejuense TaxID=584609 RepID=A0A238U8P1_9FLAO|nr:outer membrane protein transport protein [Tenacibaculum jejuense]SNR14780.1 putative outer membrane protein precursor [Tenacibaculum jejuense]
MKKLILFVAIIATTGTSYAQFTDYNDLGILFSRDQRTGTARFNAMAGAFGALGSDISSTDINPAGAAVARNSKVSVTFEGTNTNFDLNYYGRTNNITDERINLSQAGAIFVFDGSNNSNWNRFAITFNYKIKADFDNFYNGSGNSGLSLYDDNFNFTPQPNNTFYNVIGQEFSKETSGLNSVFNMGISAVHDNKLFIGASLKFHSIEYRERSVSIEDNDELNGSPIVFDDINERFVDGTGFSFNVGFIYKLNKYIRIGAAYESPTWYSEVLEETINDFAVFDTTDSANPSLIFDDRVVRGPFSLRFRTPSKLTASGALVFGKQGVISLDYTYRDFSNFRYIDDISFRDGSGQLVNPNDFFSTDFRATHALNLGTEWRFNRISLRGGYFYEKNPNLREGGNTNEDNYRGFTAGLGYNFGNTQIGLSYLRSLNDEFYTLYDIGDININNTTSRIAASITFSL